ncbi:MAG TPA: class I SAM-dependent methyltransferase [Thermoanaerobaculia bacterium]
MATSSEIERIAQLWDKTARDRVANPIQGWLDSPIVLENYVQPRVSGSPAVNWLVGTVDRFQIPRGGAWVSLGCGAAGQEIHAARAGLFGSLLALDASEASLEQARKDAAAQGVTNIEFGSVDLNRVSLRPESFDVVLMNMSLHHVRRLPEILDEILRALRPDGFFLINEFIGPRQFQFTDLQIELVAELLELLPASWRRDVTSGEIKSTYQRMPVEHWNVADPSEAIRSDRIVPEIERRFAIVARLDYGGTLLNLLLEHIIHNFDPGNEKDVAAIRLLAKCEELLVRHGVIGSDFTVMVMRKPGRLWQKVRGLHPFSKRSKQRIPP